VLATVSVLVAAAAAEWQRSTVDRPPCLPPAAPTYLGIIFIFLIIISSSSRSREWLITLIRRRR